MKVSSNQLVFRTCVFVVGVVGALALASQSAYSQPPEIPVSDHWDSSPVSVAPVSVLLQMEAAGFTMDRMIPVERQDEQGRKNGGQYSHHPIFAFTEREEPLVLRRDDNELELPSIVHAVHLGEYETLLLTVEVILSTPEFRALSTQAALKQDIDYWLADGLSERDVRVERWPLYQLFLYCYETGSTEQIAFARSRSNISRSGDKLVLQLELDPYQLEQFCKLASEERLEFIFYYRGREVQSKQGSAETSGRINIQDIIERELTGAQIDGPAKITRADVDRIMRGILLSTQTVIRGDVDTVAVLQSMAVGRLRDRLFAPGGYASLAEISANQDGSGYAIDGFMQPGEQYQVTTKGAEQMVSDTDSSSTTTRFGLGASYKGLTGSFNKSWKRGSSRTTASATSEQEVDGTSGLQDYNVQVFKLKEGWQTVELEESVKLYLRVGSDNSFREDSPIPITFTETALRQAIESSSN